MAINNLSKVYGKLRGGLQIMNETIGEPGTLGMIVLSGGVPYLISAKHVLAKDRPAVGDKVVQPAGQNTLATVERVGKTLDCAAARLVDGAKFALEILHIGPLGAARSPEVGDARA